MLQTLKGISVFNGLDQMVAKLDALAKLDGQQVALDDLFDSGFLCEHSTFASYREFASAAAEALGPQDELLELLATDEGNAFIRERTRFASWEDMKSAAAAKLAQDVLAGKNVRTSPSDSVSSSMDARIADAVHAADTAFRRCADTRWEEVPAALARAIHHLDREPLRSTLSGLLPAADFDAWLAKTTAASTKGIGAYTPMHWPLDDRERVAIQLAVLRKLADGTLNFPHFAYERFSVRNMTEAPWELHRNLLSPMLDDLQSVVEQRYVSPALADAMTTWPVTGDADLDSLLHHADAFFSRKDPASRKLATEKLWDAWERLKTLEGGNKKASADTLLDRAATPGGLFREVLTREARELTQIGNDFHIRHFEVNRQGFEHADQVEYLFHRLYALMRLLVAARAR